MRVLNVLGITLIVVVTSLFAYLMVPVWIIDNQLDKLCRSEGGFIAFEVVRLSQNQFRKDGYPVFMRDKEYGVAYKDQLGPEYELFSELETVEMIGKVHLRRRFVGIRRVADDKVLSTMTEFIRHPNRVPLSEGAGKICPDPEKGMVNTIKSTFILDDANRNASVPKKLSP